MTDKLVERFYHTKKWSFPFKINGIYFIYLPLKNALLDNIS
jgi:hypothetical protein